jgi:hypothetical protein
MKTNTAIFIPVGTKKKHIKQLLALLGDDTWTKQNINTLTSIKLDAILVYEPEINCWMHQTLSWRSIQESFLIPIKIAIKAHKEIL